ncbi:MAG TPA: 50S ribosomal protein L15 [Kiloniellales bacterium]
MKLNELADNPGARRAPKRLGRGIGSGTGKTAGRGHKGQRARSGLALNGFEGGQMPLHRRLPKRGFKNIFAKRFVALNLDRVQGAIDANKLDPKKPIDAGALQAAGVIKNPRDGVRLLARGALKSKISITVAGASRKAVEAVEKAGGSITVAPARTGAPASDTVGAGEKSAPTSDGAEA